MPKLSRQFQADAIDIARPTVEAIKRRQTAKQPYNIEARWRCDALFITAHYCVEKPILVRYSTNVARLKCDGNGYSLDFPGKSGLWVTAIVGTLDQCLALIEQTVVF